MAGNTVAQTLAAAPNITGGAWRAPLASTLPTDTTTALTTPLVPLGYVGDQGVTRTENRLQTKKFAWGGSLVASLQQSYSVTYTFQLLQTLDPDVLMAVHYDGNVRGTTARSTVGTITGTAVNRTMME